MAGAKYSPKQSQGDQLMWLVEAEECRRSLKTFLKSVWHIFEPREFVDGFVIDCLADHLSAVTRGDIRYLLINIPPRHSKSSIVSVVWPLWGWLLNPSEQYLCSSFNLNLAIRDNTRKRRIIEDTWFNQRFGKDIVLSEEQNLKQYFTNTKNGHQQITSVGGSTTGLGGSVLICVSGATKIATEHGELAIKDIVEGQIQTKALSYNHDTDTLEYKPIVSYMKQPNTRKCVRVSFYNGDVMDSVECTEDHRWYTWKSRGIVQAKDLGMHDRVYIGMNKAKADHTVHPVKANYGDDGVFWRGFVDTVEPIETLETVYNIEVQDNHNYLANNVLLKNCDDPHNVDEAYSDAERQSAVIWFRESWTNRMNNAAKDKMVVVGQRIHEDDVSGYILKERPDWDTLILPAFYEPLRKCFTSIGWEDPRTQEGELLWPERFSQESLNGLQRDLGPTGFSSQYQQSPVPAGGGTFKESWMRYFSVSQDNIYTLHTPEGQKYIPKSETWRFMTVDLAISTKTDADFTVVQCWAVTKERDILLLDQLRERMDNPQQQSTIRAMYYQYMPNYVQIEKVAYQLAIIQQLLREGVPCREYNPVKDKISRASTAAVLMYQGKIYFRSLAPWLDILKHELLQFPRASHDDTVDATSIAADTVSSFGDAHWHIANLQARAAIAQKRATTPAQGVMQNGVIAS